MKQKVALTAAHLLAQGKVADMGMGSGAGSDALAALYPELDVVGVDLDDEMVDRARKTFERANLTFRTGDIASEVFAKGSLDGIFNSSVLHHVTSYNGYHYGLAEAALRRQLEQLKEHGVLIVRDFVAAEDGPVWLDVQADDDRDGSTEEPTEMSDSGLLGRFAREFRSLSEAPGFDLAVAENQAAPEPRPGFRRYRLCHRHAVEFVLRKDYRRDWHQEVQEEYCYYTQRQFEAVFRRLGLRILASTPIHNPWIVENRFRDKVFFFDSRGRPLDPPPTNYVIVGEKVAAEDGVDFIEKPFEKTAGFLKMLHFRHRDTCRTLDVVRRPNLTLDVIPWFLHHGEVFVVCRTSYPRPILGAVTEDEDPLAGLGRAKYVTEPLNVLQSDQPLGSTVEDLLGNALGLADEKILELRPGSSYYPSPGGVMEEVRSVHVQIEPLFVHRPLASDSGFSSSGRLQAVPAQQLLRSAQVGGLPEARLELNVYQLLHRLGQTPDDWIGALIALRQATRPREICSLSELASESGRRRFVASSESAGFLDLRSSAFDEVNFRGEVVASQIREYVLPKNLSPSTAATVLLRRRRDEIFLGLDEDDRPVAQAISGNSRLMVTPAWRLPSSLNTGHAMHQWLRQRLSLDYGLESAKVWDLGGPYHPSAGVTPEIVHPLAVEILDESDQGRALRWVPVDQVFTDIWHHPDGHLRILALRAAHALGRLGPDSFGGSDSRTK